MALHFGARSVGPGAALGLQELPGCYDLGAETLDLLFHLMEGGWGAEGERLA